MLRMDVDVAVRAHEAHQEPVLALAAIFAAPHLAHQMIGQVIEMFGLAARDDFDQPAMDAGFLAEFADRGFFSIFTGVDPALRHLPCRAVAVAALAGEDPGSGDAESRMRLRSIDVQLPRLLEEISAGRQESMAEMRTGLAALTRAVLAGKQQRGEG